MKVPDLDPQIPVIIGQILRHPLGQGRHKDPLFAIFADPDLLEKVVHLVLSRLYHNPGIDKPCGTDDLLHDPPFGLLNLKVGRCGRHIDRPGYLLCKLLKGEGPVVQGRRESESVAD